MAEHKAPHPKHTGHFKDARSRSVTLLDPYALKLLRRHDLIPPDTLASIADEVGFGLPKWQRRGYLACVLTFLACVVFLIVWKIVRRSGVDTLEYVLWPTNLAVFALGAVKFWQSAHRVRTKHVCAIMLKHLRCPHCGYDIRGLPTDPQDGATVCPECGCAWKLGNSGAVRQRGSDGRE
ncbi:MAG: hypothetical protein GY842_14775 [bacterium]|nr:hypothetical protein [bacterium]